MNPSQRISLAILILLSIVILAACGSFQLEFEDRDSAGSDPEQEQTPVEVLVARDTALIYVRGKYGEEAPQSGLEWSVVRETPEGLVGASTFRFESQDWTMTIVFPIVAPDATIYSIELINAATGFQWGGQVDAQGNVTEMDEAPKDIPVIAWAGRFEALVEGAGPNDYFVMSPEGVGAVGVEGVNEEVESMINLLTASDTDDIHNIWGTLTCGVDDFNDCRILVERIRSHMEMTSDEVVEGWEGVIYDGPPGPRSGGDDYFALVGDFPVQFGIWAMDEGLRAELEALRDTQKVIRIWGTLVAGLPDWNLTQINVERYEFVDAPSGAVPPAPTWDEPDRGWMTYTNQRYGYRFQYPTTADIEEIGPQGYPSDENGLPVGGLPEGVTLDTYFAYLEETYGNNLCVGIKYSLGYIYISAAENAEARYATCGRTGVGVAEIIPKEEQIVIAGMSLTAKGMEVKGDGETLDAHNETMVATLPDGTRIEYGAAPHDDATYEDYLMKTREVLLQILETFEYLD
jgi:hypothetical protein